MWQISLSYGKDGRVLPVLSLSPTKWREMEALRDRILFGCGTEEPFIPVELSGRLHSVAMQWRRPLRVDEVSQMAPTEDVRLRRGRP